MNDNKQWLRKQAIGFLDSKKNDVELVTKIIPMVVNACEKRGLTHTDFSLELRTINEERKNEKEAMQVLQSEG